MDQIMQLGGVGFWGTVLIGILAGWLAEKFTGSDHGLIMNLIIGLIGSWIGFFIASKADIQLGEIFHGWFWGNLLVSAAGAIILLTVLKLFRGSRR
ncbi:GlsB/YeaQ/YmgE family stress response membrane protein [Aestuariivirga sp.]|uniref:GlsB/YeaQ/YmgE family stress response membrane protein n=1 Tax=Aestuariivirga sp. TaxID=2650926 RepID=UPI0039E631A6